MKSDMKLIGKMKQGDEEAFDIFIHIYYPEILSYCNYHCSDKCYAQDLTQETFIHFFANLSSYRHSGKTKNYLYTIAGNLCKDFYKKKKELYIQEQDLEGQQNLQYCSTEDVIHKVTIEWALEQLSDELREVIILYYFQELKLTEIASILQISLPLVKYRVRQAKMKLGELLQKEEDYESECTGQCL